jgi:hypothetical protein
MRNSLCFLEKLITRFCVFLSTAAIASIGTNKTLRACDAKSMPQFPLKSSIALMVRGAQRRIAGA